MRVLCLDPHGLLGGQAKPVLFPDYGATFIHVPALGGEHRVASTEFLYGGDADEAREVWLLVQAEMERFEIERHANALTDQFVATGKKLTFCALLFETPAAGADVGRFFDSDRTVLPLRWVSELSGGEGQSSLWRTVLFGLIGEDANPFPELLLAMGLRLWFDRHSMPVGWRDQHHRIALRFTQDGVLSLRSVRENKLLEWCRVFDQLSSRRRILRTTSCESRLYGEPKISWSAFPERPRDRLSPLCRLLSLRWAKTNGGCFGWFLGSSDRETGLRWLRQLFSALETTTHSAREAAKRDFQDELRQIHDSEAGQETSRLNPWDCAKSYERALAESNADPLRQPDAAKDRAVDAKRQELVGKMYEAIRCRPTIQNFLWSLGLISVLVLALVFFDEQLQVNPALPLIPEAAWATGGMLMVMFAAVIGLVRARKPLEAVVQEALTSIDSLWEQSRHDYQQQCDLMAAAVRRVVMLKNLELVRSELEHRQRKLGQIDYHMDQCAKFIRLFGGELPVVTGAEGGNIDLKLERPESENPLYWWRVPGAPVALEGLSDARLDQQNFDNARLAGVAKVVLHAISPQGRTRALAENGDGE